MWQYMAIYGYLCNVCIYICIYIYIYMYIYIHTHTCVYYIYIYMYIHTHSIYNKPVYNTATYRPPIWMRSVSV